MGYLSDSALIIYDENRVNMFTLYLVRRNNTMCVEVLDAGLLFKTRLPAIW